jgi:hypothetical protein
MSRRICILADVRYVICTGGTLEVYKIEPKDGLPHVDWQPVHTKESEGDFEFWRCNNCGNQKNSWADMKTHLGRFHELIDPFNYPEGGGVPGV